MIGVVCYHHSASFQAVNIMRLYCIPLTGHPCLHSAQSLESYIRKCCSGLGLLS